MFDRSFFSFFLLNELKNARKRESDLETRETKSLDYSIN